MIEEDDPPIWGEIFDYLLYNPETTDEQLIQLFPDEDEEMLKDFNKKFRTFPRSIPMLRLQYEFGNIFSDTDIRFFLGFHDVGTNTHDDATQRRMLRLIWQYYFRELFIQRFEIMGEDHPDEYVNLEDLTIPEFMR